MPVLKVKKNGAWEDVYGASDHTHTKNEIVDFPIASPVSDAVGEMPTAEEFNALLAALRNAGLLANNN